ncbi:MAG: hypothetical protein GY799_20695 [Desulfobulbaceae bacterium]|nr:hypothetical protein [Desulfobulbaceae bacterium]
MNEIFTFAWQFFCNNFKYVALLSVPFTLLAFPSYFIAQPAENRVGYITIIGLIVYIVGFAMYMSSLIFFMSQGFQGKLQSVKSNIINGLIYAPLLMITLLIANSPLIAAGVILFTSTSLSFLALPLIILGIYVSLRSTFAPFHLILEGCNPLESIKTSFSSTKGRVSKIVKVLMMFYIATSIVEVVSTSNTNVELFNILMFLIGVAVTLLMTAFQQIVVFKMYISCFDNKK